MGGHPFKYKDDTERAQAAHESHRKYYQMNKKAICEKNSRYRANWMTGNAQCTTTSLETATMKLCPTSCPTSETSPFQIIIVPESKQTTGIRRPVQQFCKKLYDQLLCSVETWETAICKLLEVLTHLEEVQVGLQALEASVLEEMGMTRFFKECKKIIAAIEELWCYGTSGMSDLADRRRQGDLLLSEIRISCILTLFRPSHSMSQKLEAQYLSPAQCAFLAELYDRFDKIPISDYDKFLESVYEVWFARWPEHNVYLSYCGIYPGGDTTTISSLGEAIIQAWIPKRRELIKNYFFRRKAAHLRNDFDTARCIRVYLDMHAMHTIQQLNTPAGLLNTMAPPTWAMDEQDVILMSMLAEYCTYMPTKNYMEFWPKINKNFFAQCPVHKIYYPDVDDKDKLTEEQKEVYKTPLKKRKEQIVCWYRWKTNPARLACSGGSRGVLAMEKTLAGGTSMCAPKEVEVYSQMYYADHIKQSADNAIAEGGITSCGSKLRMRRETTAEKYEAESITVKEKLKKKFKKARKVAQAKVREEVDDDTKIKAIHDLPVVLDRIFRHLSHMTGGWKFSILMGGRNPEVGGNIRFFDYHLGECATGGQFADLYVMYSEVLKAFVSFVDSTIKHEDSLPATNRDHDREREIKCDDNDSDDEGSDSEVDEVHSGESTAAAKVPGGNIGPGSSREWGALYQLTPNECNASPSQTQFNLLAQDLSSHTHDLDFLASTEPFDYEAAISSFLETSVGASMDSEGGADLHLPFLPPVGREVPIPPFVWPMPPTPLAFQLDPALHGPQPPVSIEAPAHTLSAAPAHTLSAAPAHTPSVTPAPPTFQQASATHRPPTPSTSAPPTFQPAPAMPRPHAPSTFEPEPSIPAPLSAVPALPTFQQASATPRPPTPSTSAPPTFQPAPAMPRPPTPSTFEPESLIPTPQASQSAPASESRAPSVSAPSVSAPSVSEPTPALSVLAPEPLPVSVSQPIARHIEEEQPGARHTGRARRSVPFNRCELNNVIGDTPQRSGQVGRGANATSTTQGSKRSSKRNAENTGNTSNKKKSKVA
ncbi:uncharacterized protein EDB91DRAFT_1085996 [Suillus paluster]|uniref:uncharacterized protein n=1 Tax=Suillus paluster TaxID=48578 RepID=UPI001B865083|nr:uncharacterized protein EDB91DRAFT_1085996 [Suillus paluster]KAG1728756.1 hypothetical protein EDB91DRAFT_1085996 [Suillus paluster]